MINLLTIYDFVKYLNTHHFELHKAEVVDTISIIGERHVEHAIKIKTHHFGEHIIDKDLQCVNFGGYDAFYDYRDFHDFIKIMNEIEEYFKLQHMNLGAN